MSKKNHLITYIKRSKT